MNYIYDPPPPPPPPAPSSFNRGSESQGLTNHYPSNARGRKFNQRGRGFGPQRGRGQNRSWRPNNEPLIKHAESRSAADTSGHAVNTLGYTMSSSAYNMPPSKIETANHEELEEGEITCVYKVRLNKH
jgi:hypothetical protein